MSRLSLVMLRLDRQRAHDSGSKARYQQGGLLVTQTTKFGYKALFHQLPLTHVKVLPSDVHKLWPPHNRLFNCLLCSRKLRCSVECFPSTHRLSGAWHVFGFGDCTHPIQLFDMLASDTHYKYFVLLIVPTSAYFVIANWVGWQYYRNS